MHELGVDDDGRVFFTMRLVRGRELRAILALARDGAEGWSTTRALGVLLKVCEALAYAHNRGVIHRDLKPANVMVGRFGETYVMDWGLGRVLGSADTRDLRIRGEEGTRIALAPRSRPKEASDEPLYTVDGEILGTPAYMPPEQAAGEIERMDARSDVYSVGAILYQLLAGHPPYGGPGGASAPREILELVRSGPPRALREIAPHAPPELVAIAERAMARTMAARYPDVGALSEDLHAFLDNRVVRAYRTGPWPELKKWVRRNRAFAAASAALVAVIAAGGFGLFGEERARRRSAERDLAEQEAAVLAGSLDALWPVHPDALPEMEAWIAAAERLAPWRETVRAELAAFGGETHDALLEPDPRAEDSGAADPFVEKDLRARLDGYRGLLAQKRAEIASGAPPERAAFLGREISVLEGELPGLEAALAERRQERRDYRPLRYADPELERRHRQLSSFARDLDFVLGERGLGVVRARAEAAGGLRARTLADAGWAEARASIADPALCPLYGGLALEPQLGLVPLGRDPSSGLWEFWHVLSGERPGGEPGGWTLSAETGIVLVLIPGGEVWLGAQETDPQGHDFVDPAQRMHVGLTPDDDAPVTRPNERPVHAVVLAPFFVAKHELTQGQWQRLTGVSPSKHYAGLSLKNTTIAAGSERIGRTHPVENVSWREASDALAHVGLGLPTETQWERAARAGGETAYFWGGDFAARPAGINFGDLSLQERGAGGCPLPVEANDGWSVHAPVDACGANAFGLFGVTGNVWEWCRDWADRTGYPTSAIRSGTGEHEPALSRVKSCRGGSFLSRPVDLRVALRDANLPDYRAEDLGVRPARPLDNPPR